MIQAPSSSSKTFELDLSNIKKYISGIRRNISKRYLLLEFNDDSVLYGEARIINDQFFLSKVNSVNIGADAIERGTPVDSDLMASFIKEIISEDNIWAHRVGIVLPPQAVFCKIIHLPANLNSEEAREFVISSKSGFQFPIALNQTDYDLIPINDLGLNDNANYQSYFLSSVPKKLIDKIIETLNKADLELSFLDLSFSSLEKLAYSSINKLQTNQMILIIELCNECSHFYLYNKFGPIQINTLAAIRSFPNPDEEEFNNEISIEEKIINSDEYLPITELDLTILVKEIKNILSKINPNSNLIEIFLSGRNSSHPNIAKIFEKLLEIKTTILRPINNELVMEIAPSKPIVFQTLSRIVGVGLNPLISEALLINKKNNSIKEVFNPKSNKNKRYLEFQAEQLNNQQINSEDIKDINNEINLNNKTPELNDNNIRNSINSVNKSTDSKQLIETNSINDNKLELEKKDSEPLIRNESKSIVEEESFSKDTEEQFIDNKNIENNEKVIDQKEFKVLDFNSDKDHENESIVEEESFSKDTEEQFIDNKNIENNEKDMDQKDLDVLDFNTDEDHENESIDNINIEKDIESNNEKIKKDNDFEMPDL